MANITKLKRHAEAHLSKLELQLPVFTWEETVDPIKMNAVFSQKEWEMDSPLELLNEKRDWQHWYACDPSTATQLEIFFERLEARVAIAWVYVELDGRRLILRETMYKDNSDGHTYAAGGIRLECNAPMRRWRLAVNAIVEDLEDQSELHLRLGAQVGMMGHTFELPKQIQASFLATVFSNRENIDEAKEEISKCCGQCQAVVQPVTLFAEFILNGQRKEHLLFGSRLKFIGNSDFLRNIDTYVAYAENGTTCTAFRTAEKIDGYGCNPRHFVQPIRKGRWSEMASGAAIDRVCQKKSETKEESLLMHIAGVPHEFFVNFLGKTPIQASDVPETAAWSVGKCVGSLLTRKESHAMLGTVFTMREVHNLPEEKLRQLELLRFPLDAGSPLLLSTSESECKDPKLTGGKGSSLAVLTGLSKHFKTFSVPPAVVLTVNAYKTFAESSDIQTAIDELLRDSKGADMTQLKIASDKCVSAISKSSLPDSLSVQLFEKLHNVFGSGWESRKFAVRSSAIGEDSEEMSAAGQMTTYLGMKGKDEIRSAVVQCWASQFALTAINYKRQYGQELNSSMAVVVQEMVSAESAGVMFTCDPLTSNPSDIFITANFGLGESVVSATADPDTYSLHRDRDKIILKSKTCRKKDRMVVESESGRGTEEKTIDSERAQTFCLTDDRAIELASIGAALSDVSNSPKDIEWAVVQGQIHLLQSRPVTSFLRESDYEIRHDLNTAFYTNREIWSRANLDEIMPGVFSPLGISTLIHTAWETFCKIKFSEMNAANIEPSQFTYHMLNVCGKKSFMNYSKNPFTDSKSFMDSTSLNMFGFDMAEQEAMKKGILHEQRGSIGLKHMKFILDELRGVEAKLQRAKTLGEEIQLKTEGDSLTLFLDALRLMPGVRECLKPMTSAAIMTSMYNIITLNILKGIQGEKSYTPELMVLLSRLLRSDYVVESVQIPKELMIISNLLRKDPAADRFKEMTPEEALEWLERDDGEAARKFRTFKEKNAHRCYKEFDIHAKTWDIYPLLLVQTLQSNVRCEELPAQDQEGLKMTIDQLPRRPSFMQKTMLNYFVRKTQFAVFIREAAKSNLIKVIHKLRLSMRRVGQQMQAEGRLADPELVFFFTCDELFRFMKTRDPSLLPRAIRRQKMHAILDQERFPSLLYGMPKPIDSSKIEIDPKAQSMKGTPVSGGMVVGPARVVKNFLTEAHLIEKGDILITRATDTGWTPYFPLLAGVVTEMGGLLSHGAVVAREYGLPAVVGLLGVTEFVKSGEIVTLDGDNGLLMKSPREINDHDSTPNVAPVTEG